MSDEREGEARAWAWVAHLRDGGTTPWSAWGSRAGADEQSGRYLPGAQQLELLRRLNLERLPSPELAERVLAASAPGRGRPDLGLVGVLASSAFGPPPVDPADLPDDELVRVATAVIAEDVVAAGDPLVPRPLRLLRRRRYRLLGDPEVATPLRDALLASGRPPGGRRATVVVAGTDLASMLVHLWTARSLGAGVRSWPEWLRSELGPALPARIDLDARAREWVAHVGASRVHVVLDDPKLVARLTGRRRPRVLRPLSAEAVELARRTAPVVGSLVPPERRTALMWHRLRPVLAAHPGPPLRVPARYHAWLADQTGALRRRLAAGDYAVHGTLPDPVERSAASRGVGAPDDARVLALAIQVLLGPSMQEAG